MAFTPLVLSLLKLALNKISLLGSMGSLVSLFSARINSSRLWRLAKAPSSISAMTFPVRSILLNVTGNKRERGSTCCQGASNTVQESLTAEIISTHVSEVVVPYFSDFVKACIQIACFLRKYWNGGHLRGHFLTINRPSEADAQQACWHLWKTHKHPPPTTSPPVTPESGVKM